MGMNKSFIARLKQFVRSTRAGTPITRVTGDPGGGANRSMDHYSAPGDDAHPLENDYVFAGEIRGSGRHAALGYQDPVNAPQTNAGEKRIYSRDPATGEVIAEAWLRNDGAIIISGPSAAVEMMPDGATNIQNGNAAWTQAANGALSWTNGPGAISVGVDGTITLNGVTISPAGLLTSPVQVVAPSIIGGGKELSVHVHPAGTPPSNTGPNL